MTITAAIFLLYLIFSLFLGPLINSSTNPAITATAAMASNTISKFVRYVGRIENPSSSIVRSFIVNGVILFRSITPFAIPRSSHTKDMNDNTNALLLKRHAMLSVANIMQALIKNTSGLVNANTSACTRECLAAVSIIKFMRSAITAVTVRLLTYFFCASLRYMSFILFILSAP